LGGKGSIGKARGGSRPAAVCDRQATPPAGPSLPNPPGGGSFRLGLRWFGRNRPQEVCPAAHRLAQPRIPQPQDPSSFSDRLSDSTDLSGPSRCRWVRCGRIGIGLGRWWVWEVIVFPWDDEAGSWVSGSAGPVLRAQGSSGEVWIFRAVREGGRVIASSACSGPVPLPLGDVRGDVCPAAAGCVVGGCV
jgi:hypothetical protein